MRTRYLVAGLAFGWAVAWLIDRALGGSPSTTTTAVPIPTPKPIVIGDYGAEVPF